jgi:hypothetical protein
LALAARVTASPPSRWPWQKPPQNERDTFVREWDAAVLEEVDLDGSGYLLSSYFLAQNVLNGLPDPFDAPEGLTLAKVFTAAFPLRAPLSLPTLEAKALAAFCSRRPTRSSRKACHESMTTSPWSSSSREGHGNCACAGRGACNGTLALYGAGPAGSRMAEQGVDNLRLKVKT